MQQRLGTGRVPGLHGIEQRGVAVRSIFIDTCAFGDEQFHTIRMAGFCCQVQGCLPLFVGAVYGVVLCSQALTNSQVPGMGPKVQGGVVCFSFLYNVAGLCGNEYTQQLGVSLCGCF